MDSDALAEESQRSEPESQSDFSEHTERPFSQPNIENGPLSWNPEVQLELRADHRLEWGKAKSSVSHSSVVNDHGDARHLSESRGPSLVKPTASFRDLTGHIVAHSGAVFDVFESAEDVPNLKVPEAANSTDVENLAESIRGAFRRSAVREGKDFLPINDLDRIVTKRRIWQELSSSPTVMSKEQLNYLTDQIWEVNSPPRSRSSSKMTTRRRIFAILAMMQKSHQIANFIEEGLYDSDLPFIISEGERKGLRKLDRKGKDGKLHPIKTFTTWPVFELEYFDNAQWELLAPYFTLSTKQDTEVLHYPLEDKIILPFIEDYEVKHAGGYGDVWRVKIHPAHHNHCEDTAVQNDNPSFAVKRLRHNNDEAFKTEVSNLKKFSAKDHLHLIKLLVTFKWREQYYLLFPWADGNLQDFWKLHPSPSDPRRDYYFTLWFSEQCLGVAEGLKMIHTLDKPNTEDTINGSSIHQVYGRHGDLKPENILWFKEYDDIDSSIGMGVLKISDFGLTRFHGTVSKSNINAEGVAVTGTYRAPEYDVNKIVSQSYDIWTLGCVVLEFVTWYLLGWEEVDKFSQDRVKEHVSEYKEDVFFNFVSMQDKYGITQTGARAKQSVADEFQTLYQHEYCSDFIFDLLQFIQTKLLRMNSQNRAQCHDIVEMFTDLHSRCSKDRQYCTIRTKKTPDRSETQLSLLTPAPVDLSPATDRKVNRNSLPVVPVDFSEFKSIGTSASHTSSRDFASSGKIHQEPDGMETETDSRPQSSSSSADPRNPRPQPSLRRSIQFARRASKDKPIGNRDLQDIPGEDEITINNVPHISGQENFVMPDLILPEPADLTYLAISPPSQANEEEATSTRTLLPPESDMNNKYLSTERDPRTSTTSDDASVNGTEDQPKKKYTRFDSQSTDLNNPNPELPTDRDNNSENLTHTIGQRPNPDDINIRNRIGHGEEEKSKHRVGFKKHTRNFFRRLCCMTPKY